MGYRPFHDVTTGKCIGVIFTEGENTTVIPRDDRNRHWREFKEWEMSQPEPLDLSDIPPRKPG